MSQHWSLSLHIASNGTCPQPLKEILPALNALTESLLLARAREDDRWRRALRVSDLVRLGLPRDECRDLLARGLIASDGKLCPSSRIVLTDSGLAVLQFAIPFGAVRPIYNPDSRSLSVTGETILHLATQARNLAPLLTNMEQAGWPLRVKSPLHARPCGNDAHHLADATHRLSKAQTLLDFHSDDGAVTWNWRPTRETSVENCD